MADIDPRHTKIDKLIPTVIGTIVLENHARFPSAESNLYCVGDYGRMVWTAEKPEASALYTKVKLNDDGETLSAYTAAGHACELNLRTGKLISQAVIK